jgi:hypothetical protein
MPLYAAKCQLPSQRLHSHCQMVESFTLLFPFLFKTFCQTILCNYIQQLLFWLLRFSPQTLSCVNYLCSSILEIFGFCSLYHPQMLPTKRGHISNSESHPYSHAFHSCIILEWYFCLTCIMLMPALFFLANNIPNKTPIGNNNVLITSHAL